MKDNAWKQDVHRLVDDGVGDAAKLGVRINSIRAELMAQGYPRRKAEAMIEAEAEKYSRQAFRVK